MHTHSKQSKHRGLKLVSQSVLFSLLILSTQTVAAASSGPVDMAEKTGFTNCNSLIRDVFRFHNDAQEYRTNVRYSDETIAHSIDIDMVFGNDGEPIVQSTHFERRDGFCYAYTSVSYSEKARCVDIMHRDEFKYIASSGGAIWAKNKLGATGIMTQTGDVCTSKIFGDKKMKQDRN